MMLVRGLLGAGLRDEGSCRGGLDVAGLEGEALIGALQLRCSTCAWILATGDGADDRTLNDLSGERFLASGGEANSSRTPENDV